MTTDKRNKGLLFLISLFFAVIFWIFVLADSNPLRIKDIRNVSVEIRGEENLAERGLMVHSKGRETVTVRLEGTASALNSVSDDWLDAYIDVSRITSAGEYDLNVQVINMANSSATIKSVNSAEIKLEIAERTEKEVPVEVQFDGEIPEDHWIGEVSWEPQRIHLSGARQEIMPVSKAVCHINVEAVIAAYEQSGNKGSYSANITAIYEDENGNVVELGQQQSVIVTMRVARKKRVAVDLSGSYTGAPARGYRAGGVSGNVASVEIIGAPEALEAIQTIGVTPIVLSGERSQVVKSTTFAAPAEGVSVLGDGSIVLTIEILPEE